jgi:peptidoglycan/LPS O-acetylase OafA/YrhL
MSKLEYQPHIDGLRAVAILTVLLFHAGVSGFSGGYIGVDVFFVISGYLITAIVTNGCNKQSFNFRDFYIGRGKRLLPALLVTVLLTFIAALLILAPQDLEELSKSLIASLFSLSNIFFWLSSNYFDQEAHMKPLLHTWSLGVGEQFYLLWPVLLVLLLKKYPSRLFHWIFAIALTSFALNFIFSSVKAGELLNETLGVGGDSTIFYLTPFRIFEFCIGALINIPVKKITRPDWQTNLLGVIGLIGIALATYHFNEETTFPSYNALLPCIATAMIILSRDSSLIAILLSNRLMVGIGKISYSLYLTHWPIIVFYMYITGSSISNIDSLIMIILSVIFALIVYFLVENPIRKISLDKRKDIKRMQFSILASIIMFSGVSISVWYGEGWGWRAPGSEIIQSKYYHPKVEDSYCNKYSPHISKKTFYCQNFNSIESKNIYVWGSSVGKHLVPGLATKYPDSNIYHDWMGACNPQSGFGGYTRMYRNKPYNGCNTRNKKVMAFLLTAIPGVVILSSRYQGKKVTKITLSLIKTLQEKSHTVYVTGGLRRLTEEPGSCLLKPYKHLFGRNLNQCGSFRASDLPREDEFESQMRSINANFIRYDDFLCNETSCDILDSGHAIYRDGGHLTTEGSIYVVRNRFPETL